MNVSETIQVAKNRIDTARQESYEKKINSLERSLNNEDSTITYTLKANGKLVNIKLADNVSVHKINETGRLQTTDLARYIKLKLEELYKGDSATKNYPNNIIIKFSSLLKKELNKNSKHTISLTKEAVIDMIEKASQGYRLKIEQTEAVVDTDTEGIEDEPTTPLPSEQGPDLEKQPEATVSITTEGGEEKVFALKGLEKEEKTSLIKLLGQKIDDKDLKESLLAAVINFIKEDGDGASLIGLVSENRETLKEAGIVFENLDPQVADEEPEDEGGETENEIEPESEITADFEDDASGGEDPDTADSEPVDPEQESPAELMPTGFGLFGVFSTQVRNNLEAVIWAEVGFEPEKYKEIARPMLNIKEIYEGLQGLTQQTPREEREAIYMLVTGLNKIQKGLVNSEQMDVFIDVLGASDESFENLSEEEFVTLKNKATLILTEIQNEVKEQYPIIGQVEKKHSELTQSPNIISGIVNSGLQLQQFTAQREALRKQKKLTPELESKYTQAISRANESFSQLFGVPQAPGYALSGMSPIFTEISTSQRNFQQEINSNFIQEEEGQLSEILQKQQAKQQLNDTEQELLTRFKNLQKPFLEDYNSILEAQSSLVASLILRVQTEYQTLHPPQANSQPPAQPQQPTTPTQAPTEAQQPVAV